MTRLDNESVKEQFHMNAGKEGRTFLRQKAMQELIAAEPDQITAHLMTFANNTLVSRLLRNAPGPAADFDLGYFMQIVQEFASDHETLRKILDEKSDELIWLAED